MSNTESYRIEDDFTKLMTQLFDNFLFIGGKSDKWETLEHNGPLFPPEYVKLDIPLLYDGKEIILNHEGEEYAMLYARYLPTKYVKNEFFNKNFFNDWKQIIDNKDITDFSKCDFSNFTRYIEKQKAIVLSKEEKLEKKRKKLEQEEKYKTAKINGKVQNVGNFHIEPPGIFIGRGNNPQMGKIKKRIRPEDVTINSSNKIPPPPGHKWKNVISDKSLIWLCSWNDDITGKVKYVWMAHTSDFKSNSDELKFNTARNMKNYIVKLRDEYTNMIKSNDRSLNQLGLVIFMIDKYAIRVGNDKDITKNADTVGATGIRKEHIKLYDGKLELKFKGKDSIEYEQVHKVPDYVYNTFKRLYDSVKPGEKIFSISSSTINKFLEKYDPNLTAKVFRTFNASVLFQSLISKIDNLKEKTPAILKKEYNNANYEVAILMNHKKEAKSKKITELTELYEKSKKEGLDKEKLSKIKHDLDELIRESSVSLSTSKLNYIDPRITISFVKKYGLDIKKYFNTSLQEKFKWAFDVVDFVF